MISFELTDEQKALRDLANKFAQNEIRPVAAACDRESRFPEEVLRKAWENGLFNDCIPEEYGGLGLGVLDSCLIIEEVAWGCGGVATSLFCNNLALAPILVGGNEYQKKKYFGKFTSEFHLGSFCLSESGAGSDVASMGCRIRRDGDHYVLNGAKQWITNAGHASLFVVFATLDPAKKHKGICAIVVESGTPGITLGKKEDKMGQRASDTRSVTFDNVRVPAENLLGAEGDGFRIAMMAMDRTRPSIGSMGVGSARAAMEHSIRYAGERLTFGKPLSSHQAIAFMIADMAKDIEASRLLTWQAAWLVDQGKKSSKESSFAKCFATDTSMRVATDAVQIFGGYGYTKEYPVEKIMRDVKVLQIFEGANQIQRMVMAKEILS